MHIKNIHLHNFKKIKDFEKDFNGDVYLITGENELCKSTILQSIAIMLTGNRKEVLQKGKEKGFAKMVIGNDDKEYEINLRFTEQNPKGVLSITDNNGMKTESVTILRELLNYVDIDPVDFALLSETPEGRRKQVEIVKNFLPVEFQEKIKNIDNRVKEIKDVERKSVNLEIKNVSAVIKDIENELPKNEMSKYLEPIDIDSLLEMQRKYLSLKDNFEKATKAVEDRTEFINKIPEKEAEIQQQYDDKLKSVNDSLIEAERIFKLAKEKAKTDKENIEVEFSNKKAELSEQIEDNTVRLNNAKEFIKKYNENPPKEIDSKQAEEFNRKCEKVKKYNENKEKEKELSNKAEALDSEIKELLVEKSTLIQESKLPVDGLSIGDDGLTLNEIPFEHEQVSDSQIMEVAIKLTIAMNPNVKIFRIKRGESLGNERLKEIISFAKKHKFQGFIEQVQRGQNELKVFEYTEC